MNPLWFRLATSGGAPEEVQRKATVSSPSDLSSLPGSARSVVSGVGEQLAPSLADTFGERFHLDLSGVRIHDDSAAARSAAELGARAFTFGEHVVFGREQYQPNRASGIALIAHELAHVTQQALGSTAPAEVQERQADAAEAGGSLASVPASAPRPMLRLKAHRATSLVVTVGEGLGVSFTVTLQGGGTTSASGSIIGLPPGAYTVKSAGMSMVISKPSGEIVPSTSRFNIPYSSGAHVLLQALANATSPIPMVVQKGVVSSSPSGPDQPSKISFEAERKQLDALPEHIKRLLFNKDAKQKRSPSDYPRLLEIAKKLSQMSEAELAEYERRTTVETDDLSRFETSIERYTTYLETRHAVESEQDSATLALLGLDAIYDMYRSWKLNLHAPGYPSTMFGSWEGQPVSALPKQADGIGPQLYLKMRRSLDAFGYKNLAAFEAAIERFKVAFRENAYHVALELLDKFEHLLVFEEKKYQATKVGGLHAALAPARATFKGADDYRDAAKSQYGGSMAPGDIHAYMAAGTEHQKQLAKGRAQVSAQAGDHPLLGAQDFPLEQLGRADMLGVASIINSYISTHKGKVGDARKRLDKNHHIIFKLPPLMEQTKARQGIGKDSIWDKVLQDHLAPTVEQIALDVLLPILAIGLGIASGGSGFAAVGSFGLSAYLAVQEYQDYAFRSDMYGAQLLAQEPSLIWVVVAIIGAGVDLAGVASVIKPIRGALQTFQKSGDLVELETKLASVEEKVRKNILAAARIEANAIKAWDVVKPPANVMRGSAFGLEYIPQAAYSIYLSLRRGINTFNRWARTREAIDLIGDIGKLSPDQIKSVKALYSQAVADASMISKHGGKLGMSPDQIEPFLRRWAQNQAGTADDVIRAMSRTPAQERALTAVAARRREVRDLIELKAAVETDLAKARSELAALRSEGVKDQKAIRAKVAEVTELETELRGFGTSPGTDKIAAAEANLAQAEAEAARSQLSLYDRMRAASPSEKARQQTLKGIVVDQVGTLKTPPKPLQADHIVPVREICEMEGFAKLPDKQQKAILDAKENLIAMDGSANGSKGDRSWRTWPQASFYYDDATIAKMAKREVEVRAAIEARIKSELAKLGTGSP